jgi:hypothetical protein
MIVSAGGSGGGGAVVLVVVGAAVVGGTVLDAAVVGVSVVTDSTVEVGRLVTAGASDAESDRTSGLAQAPATMTTQTTAATMALMRRASFEAVTLPAWQAWPGDTERRPGSEHR